MNFTNMALNAVRGAANATTPLRDAVVAPLIGAAPAPLPGYNADGTPKYGVGFNVKPRTDFYRGRDMSWTQALQPKPTWTLSTAAPWHGGSAWPSAGYMPWSRPSTAGPMNWIQSLVSKPTRAPNIAAPGQGGGARSSAAYMPGFRPSTAGQNWTSALPPSPWSQGNGYLDTTRAWIDQAMGPNAGYDQGLLARMKAQAQADAARAVRENASAGGAFGGSIMARNMGDSVAQAGLGIDWQNAQAAMQQREAAAQLAAQLGQWQGTLANRDFWQGLGRDDENYWKGIDAEAEAAKAYETFRRQDLADQIALNQFQDNIWWRPFEFENQQYWMKRAEELARDKNLRSFAGSLISAAPGLVKMGTDFYDWTKQP